MSAIFGFLNLDKPLGMTSHDVVAKIRRELKVKKVGHAGTLDPLATGVLIICLGGATRLSEYVMRSAKVYRAEVRLGIATNTYDAEGEITAEHDPSALSVDDVRAALNAFQGNIEQIPPMYSAIKQNGRKLYEMARSGQVVEREARPVTIESIRIVDWSPPQMTLEVVCGAGTYIRSLAHDLGEALGVGAHLSGLIRCASGNFKLDDAVSPDSLIAAEDWSEYIVSPHDALSPMPEIHLDAAAVTHVQHGRAVEGETAVLGQIVQAYGPDGQFLAILEGDGDSWRPQKVFV
jgi:tRNA pseudouridine55 synthase